MESVSVTNHSRKISDLVNSPNSFISDGKVDINQLLDQITENANLAFDINCKIAETQENCDHLYQEAKKIANQLDRIRKLSASVLISSKIQAELVLKCSEYSSFEEVFAKRDFPISYEKFSKILAYNFENEFSVFEDDLMSPSSSKDMVKKTASKFPQHVSAKDRKVIKKTSDLEPLQEKETKTQGGIIFVYSTFKSVLSDDTKAEIERKLEKIFTKESKEFLINDEEWEEERTTKVTYPKTESKKKSYTFGEICKCEVAKFPQIHVLQNEEIVEPERIVIPISPRRLSLPINKIGETSGKSTIRRPESALGRFDDVHATSDYLGVLRLRSQRSLSPLLNKAEQEQVEIFEKDHRISTRSSGMQLNYRVRLSPATSMTEHPNVADSVSFDEAVLSKPKCAIPKNDER